MKKLFVSVPTEGRTIEAIADSATKMGKIAGVIFDEEFGNVNVRVELPDEIKLEGEKKEAWLFGEALQKIAQADYFIGIYDSMYFEKCNREAEIARQCGIPTTYVSVFDIAKDAVDIAAKEMVDDCFEKPSLKGITMGGEISPFTVKVEEFVDYPFAKAECGIYDIRNR